jgi:hypothetical protein
MSVLTVELLSIPQPISLERLSLNIFQFSVQSKFEGKYKGKGCLLEIPLWYEDRGFLDYRGVRQCHNDPTAFQDKHYPFFAMSAPPRTSKLRVSSVRTELQCPENPLETLVLGSFMPSVNFQFLIFTSH